ncbi:MAG: adenylate/guanylate cyclase domain-containing protein [Myxococcales bacterium]|nr:adenylate/guanylate cyclase domain-containing protein [Myxococcales bacterium]
MTPRRETKRAVLMNADVVGYSAMMARDATGTVEALLGSTRWLAGAVESFGGRVVDAPGDNLMAEFDREWAAIRCAMYVQWTEGWRNRHVPDHLRIRYRIGIEAGDVIDVHGRLYGNPVNVAARLQAQAEAGGVLVSAPVAERCRPQLRGVSGTYGVHQLKNIPEPCPTLALTV